MLVVGLAALANPRPPPLNLGRYVTLLRADGLEGLAAGQAKPTWQSSITVAEPARGPADNSTHVDQLYHQGA